MRIAIFENIMTPGGHEVDFDRILVEEFTKLGHEVSFYVPEGFCFALDYHVPVHTLRGAVVSYHDVRGVHRLMRTAARELRRLSWYRQLATLASAGAFDALILPTSTYRYLRALAQSRLRRSPVPVLFILHGINPHEAPEFLRAAARLAPFPAIRPTAYFAGHYTRPVRLLVQGSTMHPEDAEDFERIIGEYAGRGGVTFLHKGLIGADWQRAIAGVDALLMTYSAPRYRYHWGGMLFTAIGFEKPVVASDDMNPEVFAAYPIGRTFPSGDLGALKAALEEFINTFDERQPQYAAALAQAAVTYSPANFARGIAAILAQ